MSPVNKRTRDFIIYIITIVASAMLLLFGNIAATKDLVYQSSGSGGYYLRVEVTKILETIEAEDVLGDNDGVNIRFEAKILNGVNKDKTITALKTYDSFVDTEENTLEVGKKVLIFSSDFTIESDWYFVSYIRSDILLILGGIFFVLLILFGREKGLNTVLSLVFTCLAIFGVFIPAILSGQNIYLWTFLVCVFIILMTLLIINGANHKTWTAILGCISGIVIAGLLTALLSGLLNITGVISDESIFLIELNAGNPINLKAIVFAGVLIGAVGAVMDVAMSIASSVHELSHKMYNPNFGELLRSGLNIGRDIMGTMSNTLILAYIGSSLALVLLLVAYDTPLMYLFNRELIVVEILQALVGSIGLLFTIPFTALVSAKIYAKHHRYY